jgi:hypothetical protein
MHDELACKRKENKNSMQLFEEARRRISSECESSNDAMQNENRCVVSGRSLFSLSR